MKYLVNRETKEHRIHNYGEEHRLGSVHGDWKVIEADPEGWIKHSGGECPLPDDVGLDVRYRSGQKIEGTWPSDMVRWRDAVAYRPILNDKPDAGRAFNHGTNNIEPLRRPAELIERLRAAHKAASQLPDIIAELREVLEPMGYDLVARDPFVEAEPDMTDWRNWREGDAVECVESYDRFYQEGKIYIIGYDVDGCYGVLGLMDNVLSKGEFNKPTFVPSMFRFHSRPTKEQDK